MIYHFSTYFFHLSYSSLTMASLEDLTKQLTSSLSSLLGEKLKIYVKYLIDTYCKDVKDSDEILKKSLAYWNEQKFSFTINVNSDTLDKKATKICSAKTKDGNPCKGKCTKDTDLCASHSKKKKKSKKAKKSSDDEDEEDEDDCLKCQTMMKSGTRKGEKCGAKSKKKNGLCGRHSKSSDDEDEKPKKKKKAKSDDSSDDEKEKPKKSSDDEDEKPKKKKAKSDDEEKPKKKKAKSDDESEDKPKKKADDDEDDVPLGKPKN